jgi:hypothetical protein
MHNLGIPVAEISKQAKDWSYFQCWKAHLRRNSTRGLKEVVFCPTSPIHQAAACPLIWYNSFVRFCRKTDRRRVMPNVPVCHLPPGRVRHLFESSCGCWKGLDDYAAFSPSINGYSAHSGIAVVTWCRHLAFTRPFLSGYVGTGR